MLPLEYCALIFFFFGPVSEISCNLFEYVAIFELKSFEKKAGMKGNFVLNTKYFLTAVVSRRKSSMKWMMSL